MLLQKLIIAATVCGITVVGMRAAGVGFGDLITHVQTEASKAGTDIKALFKGDFTKQRPTGQSLTPKVGANEGDYDADMKKELAEERQRYLEERRKALDGTLEKLTDPDAVRKQIEQNARNAAKRD